MPISFVAAGASAASASGGVTPGLPAGWQANDIFLLHLANDEGDGQPADPSGWNLAATIANTLTGTPSTIRGTLWWRRATASESAPTVNGSASFVSLATITAWRGCVTAGSPLDVAAVTSAQARASSVTIPGITPATDGAMCVYMAAADDNVNTSTGWPTNASLASIVQTFFDRTSLGAQCGLWIAHGIKTTAGATNATTGNSTNFIEPANITIALKPAAAAGGADINQVTETDTAQSISAQRSYPIGQVVETDTGQAITPKKSRSVGQVVETDTAQTITTGDQTQPVNQVAETDTAQTIVPHKSRAVGLTAEADTAQAWDKAKAKDAGRAIATELAQDITASKDPVVSQVVETDAAHSILPGITRAIGQVVETDAAQSITPSMSGIVVSINPAAESDAAFPIRPRKRKVVGQVVEGNTALAIDARRQYPIGFVTETDTAQVLDPGKSRAVGQVREINRALRLQNSGVDEAPLARRRWPTITHVGLFR